MKPAVTRPGIPAPVFIAGIKYPSLFIAGIESGISETSLSKGIRRNGWEPCKIKNTFVVLEAWVNVRLETFKREYAL
jgi:hypothetical protein